MGKYFSRCAIVVLSIIIFANFGYSADKKYYIKKKDLSKTSLLGQDYGIRQGFNMRVWMSNRGVCGLNYLGGGTTPDGFGMEYPRGSGIEHLYGSAPWVGALVDTSRAGNRPPIPCVTTGYEGWSGQLFEMFGNPDGSDVFYTTSTRNYNGRNGMKMDDDLDGLIDEDPNDGIDNDGDGKIDEDYGEVCVRGFDNDLDGKIDEDELNGIDDDGDGKIDEDYGPVSESDMYVSYCDTNGNPAPILNHRPLGIKVWQRSFAWESAIKEPILAFEYYFINTGYRRKLDSLYVGFFADCDVGPRSSSGYYTRNYSEYLEDVRTALIHNPKDKPSTPVGITVLGTPKDLSDSTLRYTYQWYPGELTPTPDRVRYDFMKSGIIKGPEWPALSDTRFFFSFGPFDSLKAGDTLKIVMALVSGAGVSEGTDNLRDNAAKAHELFSRGWTTPPIPPAPKLTAELGEDRITLRWGYDPLSGKCNPIQVWDDSNKFVGDRPDTHWRRRNPEKRCYPLQTGGIAGGRIFQGFRVWRSVAQNPKAESFALLGQYDVHDDLNFWEGEEINDPFIDPTTQSNQGYIFIDSNLVRGKQYTYAVTSYSIPGITLVEIVTPGGVRVDTMTSPPLESSIFENDSTIVIPFDTSTALGQVKVVPNPYRTDIDYTFESGGWEGIGREWHEGKRVIWFIHLPTRCTIRIFTLTGDLISTIDHDDQIRKSEGLATGQEEWNLVSSSGRAIASGIYVFTVESDFGRQIGKFVVIR